MKFRTIILDPPWNETGGGKIKRGSDKHYKVLKTVEIISIARRTIDQYEHENNQHMYLWVTNNHLEDGLKVMKELGFRYITNVSWVKNKFGLGYYFRGKHELCLFGTKGRGAEGHTGLRNIPSVLCANTRAHSQKPAEFYDLVRRRSEGPFLELFARRAPEADWICAGDEVGKFTI